MIKKHTELHFDDLRQSRNLSGGLLAPAEDLKLLPFWVVAEIFYGELSSEMVAELKDIAVTREELFKHVISGGISRFSYSKYLPMKANGDLARFKARWKAFNDKAYEHAIATNNSAPIIRLYELMQNQIITAEQLLQTLDESLYANLDVTTGGISWNLVFLAAYEHYQELLRKEVAAAGDLDKYLRSSTTLLAACIAESSRLRPLAAFSVPQSAPTTRIVEGYVIPAGTDFIVDSHALNTLNEFWGADGRVYRPERFLERSATELRYQFWRFGFGPRQCMGKYVADLIIRTLIVHLVQNYELSLSEYSSKWERDPETWINHPKMLIRCEKRQSKQ